MLTLILAQPRTGKSQYAVKLGLEHKAEGKRVFVTNFNQTDAQRAQTGFEVYDTPDDWWESLPHGAVWIIDEAQDIWPQRDKSRALPEHIKLLSKHGHHDLTIYLITQDAMQLDVHIRRNCNITLYLTRPLNLNRALIYTFRGYQEMPNDAWRRSQVLKSAESKKRFKYDRKLQRLYTSASAHEHIKKRLPLRLLLLPVLVAIVAGLLWFAWSRLRADADPLKAPSSAVATVAAAVTGAEAPTAATLVAATPQQWMDRFKERVPGVPWSAPAYDGFQVKDYPRPLCIISGPEWEDSCRCYTQQATRLKVSDEQCRDYVHNGAWDPFKEPLGQGGRDRAEREPETLPESVSSSSAVTMRLPVAPDSIGEPTNVVVAPEPHF